MGPSVWVLHRMRRRMYLIVRVVNVVEELSLVHILRRDFGQCVDSVDTGDELWLVLCLHVVKTQVGVINVIRVVRSTRARARAHSRRWGLPRSASTSVTHPCSRRRDW